MNRATPEHGFVNRASRRGCITVTLERNLNLVRGRAVPGFRMAVRRAGSIGIETSPPMPIRSMTGFALVARSCHPVNYASTIKTVIHALPILHFHSSGEFDPNRACLFVRPFENAVRRGHAQIQISFKRNG